ncbi:hypothetical protein, partial [Streptomyces sp. NPDC096339]|uniref:hypothetical protein n=1 Tax=Streptomyces sp. NPDC096339 TaxID=3366086 RepID=UPI00381B9CAA
RASAHPRIRASAHPRIRASAHPRIRASAHPRIRASMYRGSRTSVYPTIVRSPCGFRPWLPRVDGDDPLSNRCVLPLLQHPAFPDSYE